MTCNRLRTAFGAFSSVFSFFFLSFFLLGAAQAGMVPFNRVQPAALPAAATLAQNTTTAAAAPASATPAAASLAFAAQETQPHAADSAPSAQFAQRLDEASARMASQEASQAANQALLGAENAIKTVEDWEQKGLASWYGPGFHGRKTASGERFDTTELTAAHLSLPFGTKLLVRNERNGKEVVVRVNDRGPYIKTRIIDLSQAAARALGIDGIGRVVIQRLEGSAAERKRYRRAD